MLKVKFNSKSLVLHDFAPYFFLLAIVTILVLFFWVISPFLSVLVYASLIAIIFTPMHKWFLKRVRGHVGVSAFITTLLVTLMVLIPLALFSYFVVQQAVDAYAVLDQKLMDANFRNLEWSGAFSDIPLIGNWWVSFTERYGLKGVFEGRFDVLQLVQDFGQAITTFVVAQSGAIAKSFGTFVVSLFILLLTTFFFLRDGGAIAEFVKGMSPLPQKYENEIENKLRDTTYAIVMGTFVTALVQGAIAALGFAIAGVHNVIFWGTVMAFTALVPYVGASIVWFPVALAFLLQGQLGWGLFILIWGVAVVSVVDNIIRPVLIGNRTKMHPLATFLTVLGGIFVFGIKGIIFGPIILSLTVTIIHIYRLEYKAVLR
ncbi:MAG: AI-2E family transporter [Candidatus Gracilibacteria bacterium]